MGAGTLSVRERGVPPSFNVVEVEDGCIRVTALAWTGSHYEPLPDLVAGPATGRHA